MTEPPSGSVTTYEPVMLGVFVQKIPAGTGVPALFGVIETLMAVAGWFAGSGYSTVTV